MRTQQKKERKHIILSIITGIGAIFCSVFIIQLANESKIYDIFYGNKISHSDTMTKKITKMQRTFEVNEAISRHKYEQALELISGTKSEDYYNRGTIQTLLAYNNALESNISGLEKAKHFIAQAQQSFDIAKKLGPSSKIREAIQENQTTVKALSPVIEIKRCYGIGQNTITTLMDITTIITDIQNILQTEETYIQKIANNLSKECYEKLQYIVNTSKEQVFLLNREIENNKIIHRNDLGERIENPMICLDMPYQNILSSLYKGKQGLEIYQEQHKNTIDVLKKNDPKNIKELCEQTKNDAEINQDIEHSVQEMLQELNNNTKEEKTFTRNNQNIQYKDFFNEQEQEIIEEIQKINKGWINQILNIRSKGNYDPQKYINTMFNQFYGNPNDFIDLHKQQPSTF